MASGSNTSEKDVRKRFAALVQGPEPRLNIAEAALLIAKEEYPSLDVGAYLQRLDELARLAAPQVSSRTTSRARIESFNGFFFVQQGFTGNRDAYYEPANSYLNQVLDLKKGIPLTLALVYTEIGRRIGLPVFGVGFPGHFLVKYVGDDEEILIDVFFATLLSPDDCLERLRAMYGPTTTLEPEFLRPARPREIIVRLLRNLKQIYSQRGDLQRALACCDRILLVTPDTPNELRDRGLIYERLECFSAALSDLERFVELAPDDPSAAAVRSHLPALRQAVARLN